MKAASPGSAGAIRAELGLTLTRPDPATLVLGLVGDWKLKGRLPKPTEGRQSLDTAGVPRRLTFDAIGLSTWDSGLLVFLVGIQDLCKKQAIDIDPGSLPEGARRLLRLATAVPERQDAHRAAERSDFFS